MTEFTKEDLRSLEKLSRIALNPEMEEKITDNIQNILDYMDMLQEVDTKHTKPLTHPIESMHTPLREDVIVDNLPTKEFLENAPQSVGSFVKVPVVIEGKEEN